MTYDNIMPNNQGSGDSQHTGDGQFDDDVTHLAKMSDYKSYAKGLMDIALMSANANQLRTVLEYPSPYKMVLTGMLSTSLLLQLIASLLLVVERMTCRKHDYRKCHKYNVAISIFVVLIIFVNVFIAAFGVPEPHVEPTPRPPY